MVIKFGGKLLRRITSIIFCLFLLINISQAQVKTDALIWVNNLGFGSVTNTLSGNTLDILGYTALFEKYYEDTGFSFGFSIGFWGAEDEYKYEDIDVFDNFSNTSFYFSIKYSINHKSRFVPFVSLALGLQFGRKETAVQNVPDQSDHNIFVGRQGKTSVNIAAPFGLNYFTSENVFIGLNVTPIWTSKTFFDSNFGWAASLSLGFQFN